MTEDSVTVEVDVFDPLYYAAKDAGIDPEDWDLSLVSITDEGDLTVEVSGGDRDD